MPKVLTRLGDGSRIELSEKELRIDIQDGTEQAGFRMGFRVDCCSIFVL
jgi:hypothetical protein